MDLRKEPRKVTNENQERIRAEESLHAALRETCGVTGDEFLLTLVRHLTTSVDVRCAYVARLHADASGDRFVRTVRCWIGHSSVPEIEFKLAGSAVESIIRQEIATFPSDVAGAFPDDPMLPELRAQSFVGAPVIDSGGETIGLLALIDDKPMDEAARYYALSLVSMFVARCAAELERDRTVEELRRAHASLQRAIDERTAELGQHRDRAGLLHEMSERVQSCRSLTEAQGIVPYYLGLLYPNVPGALYLFNDNRTFLQADTTWGQLDSNNHFIDPEDCWCLRQGKLNLVGDPRRALNCRHVTNVDTGPYLCTPMSAHGEICGMLHLRLGSLQTGPATGHRFVDLNDACQLAISVADTLAVALNNVLLRESLRTQSIRDPASGLFNRRYLAETLEREASRVTRYGQELSIAIFDIDSFAELIDGHGFAMGDLLLTEVARVLVAITRTEDIACRFGDHQVAMIMPNMSLENAVTKVEAIRATVHRIDLSRRANTPMRMTLSAGIATFPRHTKSTQHVLRLAEDALERAKESGDDRVEIATDPPVAYPRLLETRDGG